MFFSFGYTDSFRRGGRCRRFCALILGGIILLTLLSSCRPSSSPDLLRVGALKGPTSIGLGKLMRDSDTGISAGYAFTVSAAADELTPLILRGELDAAALPANLAAILYARSGGEIVAVAVNTLGVQYIVEKGGTTVKSVADLKGQTILATGQGTVNEYNLRYLLKKAGLDPDRDVTFSWKSEPTEIVAALKKSGGIAMLPQPFVAVAKANVEGLAVALSIEDEWGRATGGMSPVTGVTVMRRAYLTSHPKETKAFLLAYAASVAYVNDHPGEIAPFLEETIGIKAAILTGTIPDIHAVCVTGEPMKTLLSSYLAVLAAENPASVGGALPGEDFYPDLS